MKTTMGLCALIALSIAPTANAVSLVVMGTNSTAVPGAKVFTVGVKITQADTTAPGVGLNPSLFPQHVTFVGSANGPIHQAGAANQFDVQGVQTNFIDPAAVGGPAVSLGTNGTNSLYRDTWWYNSGSQIEPPFNWGVLRGVVDESGGIGIVTTNPAGDGSGVYTIGPTNNVGSTGFVFQQVPAGTAPANPVTGETMYYSGLFGPFGENWFTSPPLANLWVNGVLNIPLAQIVASGDIQIPSDWLNGAGTGLIFGEAVYNVLGGPRDIDPGAFLDYTNNVIRGVPEPSTIVMTLVAALGFACLSRRARR